MKKLAYASMRLIACLLPGYISVDPTYGQKKPDFDEIVLKFIEKIEADSQYVGDNYIHQELEVDEELKNGVVFKVEQKLYQVEKRSGDLFKKLMARNDIRVTNSEFHQKKEIVSVGAKLLGRFEFHFERAETIYGEKCWVFSFKPKNDLPERTRADKMLNRLTGEAWIARETLNFKKLTAHLLSAVEYEEIGSGIKLQRASCLIAAKAIDGHFIIDYAQIEYAASGRLLFIPVVSKHVVKKIYYKSYERRVK